MATQCQLETAAHDHAVDGCHGGLGTVFQRRDQVEQIRLLQGFGRTKFFDVSAARKSFASTGDHDGFDCVIGHGLVQTLHESLARGQTQAIDRRIVQGDHGDVAVNCVISTHRGSLSEALLRGEV